MKKPPVKAGGNSCNQPKNSNVHHLVFVNVAYIILVHKTIDASSVQFVGAIDQSNCTSNNLVHILLAINC